MKNDTLYLNKESIKITDIELVDWGFTFFCDTEEKAYKAAYVYRKSIGTEVKPTTNKRQWIVTVFNQRGKDCGFC